MVFNARTIFGMLNGAWSYKRVISNYGTIDGEAVFTLTEPDVLQYKEKGRLHLTDGPVLEALQEYVYRLEDGDRLSVYFRDGRLFHHLSLGDDGRTGGGDHLCKMDFYQAAYRFEGPNAFTLIYNVKGPKKDYVSETHFIKLAAV